MRLKKFLLEASDKEELVSFEKHSINMQYRETFEGFKIITNNTNEYFYDKRGWSKIKFKENYEPTNFQIFIKLTEQIDKYMKVNFSIFEDNLRIEDFKLSSLTLFSDYKHPVEVFDFKANQPHFPFTSNLSILESNIYFFTEFTVRIRTMLFYMKVKDFLSFVKIKCNRKYDFICILEQEYSHLESNMGDLVKLCTPDQNYVSNFGRHFMPLIEKCLELIKFLPLEYIKIY